MPDPNARADHSAIIWLGLLENHFPDPGQANNPEGKAQNSAFREASRQQHRAAFPELYPTDPVPPDPPPPGSLIQPTDLVYEGAFQAPAGEDYSWSQGVCAYVPERGTLIFIGHDYTTRLAELEIPELRIKTVRTDLARATVRTPYVDVVPWDGIRDVELYNGRLFGHTASHYEYTRAPKHWAAPWPLQSYGSRGQWYVGTDPPVPHINTNGYIFTIDPAWAAAHVPGHVLGTGRHREGQGGNGPVLIAFKPWLSGEAPPIGATLPAKVILLYGIGNAEREKWVENHHKSDDWTGAFWLTGSKTAMAFWGEKGQGASWYGWQDPDGTRVMVAGAPGGCEQMPDDGIPCKEVEEDDPNYQGGNRGYCSDSYHCELMLFDPADLAKVARGELEPWQPKPYARCDLTNRMMHHHLVDHRPGEHIQTGAAAIDPDGKRIFLTERYGSSGPVIHVFKVAG